LARGLADRGARFGQRRLISNLVFPDSHANRMKMLRSSDEHGKRQRWHFSTEADIVFASRLAKRQRWHRVDGTVCMQNLDECFIVS